MPDKSRLDKIWQGLLVATIFIILNWFFPVIEGYLVTNPFQYIANTIVISLFIGLTLLKYLKEF